MKKKIKICGECDSDYFANTSKMMKLCPDCSHYLYGHTNCEHEFENMRCRKCYWNGKSLKYINGIKNKTIESE